MNGDRAIKVNRLLGAKPSPDGMSMTIGIVGGNGEYEFSCPPAMLTNLALIALQANSALEAKALADPAAEPTALHAFQTEGWEIRRSPNGAFLLISFRVVGGAWVRFQVPSTAATLMRETLESIEGRAPLPPTNVAQN